MAAPITAAARKYQQTNNNNKISTNSHEKVFRNIHSKRPVLKYLFDKVPGLPDFTENGPKCNS